MKKIIFNAQRRNKHFLIVIYHSSLVKGAMNAARLCKLRNDIKKTPQFLLFSMAKGGPSAQWISTVKFRLFGHQKPGSGSGAHSPKSLDQDSDLDSMNLNLKTLRVQFLPVSFLQQFVYSSVTGGTQRDVFYLGWPIAPLFMSPNAGGGWLWGLSQWVQLFTLAQINFGDLTS